MKDPQSNEAGSAATDERALARKYRFPDRSRKVMEVLCAYVQLYPELRRRGRAM